mmetsp:Transcript_9010/g.23521  ORF Transcript_9010/g.23521 Transcript_9010/m.23521 type:complete len:207 (+) Transcript_9010:534-1154(+)
MLPPATPIEERVHAFVCPDLMQHQAHGGEEVLQNRNIDQSPVDAVYRICQVSCQRLSFVLCLVCVTSKNTHHMVLEDSARRIRSPGLTLHRVLKTGAELGPSGGASALRQQVLPAKGVPEIALELVHLRKDPQKGIPQECPHLQIGRRCEEFNHRPSHEFPCKHDSRHEAVPSITGCAVPQSLLVYPTVTILPACRLANVAQHGGH